MYYTSITVFFVWKYVPVLIAKIPSFVMSFLSSLFQRKHFQREDLSDKIHSCSHDYLGQKTFISTWLQCTFDRMDRKILMSFEKISFKIWGFLFGLMKVLPVIRVLNYRQGRLCRPPRLGAQKWAFQDRCSSNRSSFQQVWLSGRVFPGLSPHPLAPTPTAILSLTRK